ncbi:MAG: AAA family ATPase [Planctomycetota bacterium]
MVETLMVENGFVMKTPLFVTSLEPAGGKTVVTLGLVSELSQTFENVGFIKPVGVSRVRAGRDGIDLDAMLVEQLHTVHENIKDMCPVTLGSASWPTVSDSESERMMARIDESYQRISENRAVVVVEGSGGATTMHCLGLSNAKVAQRLGCRALLVTDYGVMDENPFDAIVLHRDHFKAHEVETIGVVINKVPVDLLDSFRPYAASQCDRLGVELLGTIPEDPVLRTFRFLQISEFLDGEMLVNAENATRVVHTVRVGAMTPHRAIPFFSSGSLIITPGDREDIIVTVCAAASIGGQGPSGLVLSAGQRPHDNIMELLDRSGIPTFLATDDSYTVAGKIHDMPLRIQPTDEEKIAKVQSLVIDHVNVERVLEKL